MSVIKKAITAFRSPSTSPRDDTRDLTPSPARSPSPQRRRTKDDSDGHKPSRVASIISHVRSHSLGGSSAHSSRNDSPVRPLTAVSLPEAPQSTSPTSTSGATSPTGPRQQFGAELQRKLSMTELKQERRAEREAKEEEQQQLRRQRHEEAWKKDALRNHYGDLPINQSQIPPSRPLMGLSLDRRPSDESSASNELGLKLLAPAPGIHGLGPARADCVETSIVRDSTSDMSESDDESQEVNGKHTQKAPSQSSSSSASSSDVSSPSTCRTSLSVNERDFACEDCMGEPTPMPEMNDLKMNGVTPRPMNGTNGHSYFPQSVNGTSAPPEVERMQLTPLKDIEKMAPGTRVAFRARVHHIRALGSHIVFLVLRSQLTTVQAVLTEEDGKVSANMVRWAEGLGRETIVRVVGVVQEPPASEGQEQVKSTSVHEREVRVQMLHVIAKPTVHLPFQLDDVIFSTQEEHAKHEDGKASPTGKTSRGTQRVGDKTRLANRVIDLRTPASQAIFRIHAAVCLLYRQALMARGFVEIQSSKFQESGTESGASVFKVDYFRRPAFLAQSPQLAKQMCIAADMERVFEIGPVFRAENSNTHRHLTEFTGLDLEMAFETHYHEVLDVIDETLKTIFKGLQQGYRDEIEVVKKVFPHEDLVVLDETPRLTFAEGIRMLRASGYRDEDGNEPKEDEDLSTAAERRLGALVKEKYGADYYILDKFPLDVRPFYTMPDPENPKFSNSFDIFVRGEEILSGGQRIHHAPMLEERMKECGVDPETMIDYVNGFRWGCPPHGGGGVGLERIIMLFLKLGDIRWASLFPRDPKSFAMNGQDPVEASMAAATSMILRGPESSTFQPGRTRGEMPPLENLIARYGDATNTSWVDPAWTVWRDQATGAAVGYIASGHFAVIFGNPLCEPNQTPRVVRAFLSFLANEAGGLKPIWCCVERDTEKFLAEELGWSAVIAVAEERLNPIEVDPANNDKTVRRKIHRAERDGVKLHEVDGEPEEDVKRQIEERCREWAANRKGTQIHLTGVRPFDDMSHRKYFYATDKDGKICALVVLAQLAAVHGFQIKWALEFPGAPLGAIEYIVSFVIKKLGDAGVRSATFGAGAAQRLHGVDNVGGFRIRTLEKMYNGISHTFHLSNKGDFRGKFGIEQDPLFICYPKGGLGVRGVEAIMSVLQKPK